MINTEIQINYAVYELITIDQQKITVYLSASPKSTHMEEFTQFLITRGITDVFCFCEPVYDPTYINDYGIRYHEIMFHDKIDPPISAIKIFDQKLDQLLASKNRLTGLNQNKFSSIRNRQPCVINIHCRSGLGRAPLIVAYLMISRCDIDREDAIGYVKQFKKGILNNAQLKWILCKNVKTKQSCCVVT